MTDAEIKAYIQNQIASDLVNLPWTEDNLAIAKLVLEKALTDLISQGVSSLPLTTTLSVDGSGNLVYNWGY